jgi:hypothetical protein
VGADAFGRFTWGGIAALVAGVVRFAGMACRREGCFEGTETVLS